MSPIALVTGAARPRGIGRATAMELARRGHDVACLDIARPYDEAPAHLVASGDDLDSVVKEIEALGRRAVAVRADVSNEEEVEAAVAAATEALGTVTLVANVAGGSGPGFGFGPLLMVPPDEFRRVLDVNVVGTWMVSKACASRMVGAGVGGRIVNVSSQAGKRAFPFLGAYCAAKAAVILLTQTLATELGPQGISVNAVCPGTVDTDLINRDGLMEDDRRPAPAGDPPRPLPNCGRDRGNNLFPVVGRSPRHHGRSRQHQRRTNDGLTGGLRMGKPMHHTAPPLRHAGAVDADGHILEPPDLWERYLEPQYRDRALRIIIDDRGLEQLEIGGKPSTMSRKGSVSVLGSMGDPDLIAVQKDPERKYLDEAPFGSMDPKERLELLDAEGIDAAVLYTTIGLLWEAELEDPELSQAYTRAYNRWICEFCADSPRLVPTAHLSLSDPKAAAVELERAVGEGAKGVYVCPFTHDGRPLGHPDNDPVFDAAQGLGVPFAIHPTFEPQWTKGSRMGAWENVRQLRLLAAVTASDGVRHQFTTLFDYGVFDKFPELKIIVLESGGGWIGYWLDRIDAVFAHTVIGTRVPLERKPSDYFRERVWISCDPDERSIPALAERFGADRFLWASDFPHADHTPAYLEDLAELADQFTDPTDRRRFLGDNARELFAIDA